MYENQMQLNSSLIVIKRIQITMMGNNGLWRNF